MGCQRKSLYSGVFFAVPPLWGWLWSHFQVVDQNEWQQWFMWWPWTHMWHPDVEPFWCGCSSTWWSTWWCPSIYLFRWDLSCAPWSWPIWAHSCRSTCLAWMVATIDNPSWATWICWTGRWRFCHLCPHMVSTWYDLSSMWSTSSCATWSRLDFVAWHSSWQMAWTYCSHFACAHWCCVSWSSIQYLSRSRGSPHLSTRCRGWICWSCDWLFSQHTYWCLATECADFEPLPDKRWCHWCYSC